MHGCAYSKKVQLAAVLTGLLLLASGCRPDHDPPGNPFFVPAFYHWQTELSLSGPERKWLQATAAGRLYVKFFDIDLQDGQPVPQASLLADPASLPDSMEVVPTIFITNRTMAALSPAAVDTLAVRLWKRVAELAPGPAGEVQIDCDWTGGTRENYFRLLRTLRQQLPPGMVLSATVRLHQLRYPEETGVPPVDRGMLMYYNMGALDRWEEPNSILNNSVGASYLQDAPPYPLPLDAALPLFRWGVLYRHGRLSSLINNLESRELRDSSRFAAVAPGRYRVRESTYLGGYYLYRGDELRLEGASVAELRQAARLLRPLLKADTVNLAFYHLDDAVLNSYTHEELRSVLAAFGSAPVAGAGRTDSR